MKELALNSAGVTLGALLVAVIGGFSAALATLGVSTNTRRALLALGAASLALPPFLTANAWLELTANWRTQIGAAAAVGAMRPLTALVLGLMLWPIPYFGTLGAWQTLQSAHLEIDPRLTGWPLVQRVLWPAATPALRTAGVLVVALSLSNFTVPTLFQVRVYTEEFWIRFNTEGDALAALRATWPVLVLPPLLSFAVRGREASWPRSTPTVAPALARRCLGPWYSWAWVVLGSVVILSLGVPLTKLALNPRTWAELPGALAANHEATFVTLWTGLAAVGLALIAGAVASGGWQRPLPRRPGLTWAWFLAPGVFTGLLLIALSNRPGLTALYQSPAILVLAFALRYLAPAWAGVSAAFRSLDRDLLDALRLNGASGHQVFRHAVWPQAGRGLAATAYVIFLLCLWDVETAVLIQPPGAQTLALRIFNFLHYGHSTQVNALCIVILVLATVPLGLLGWWQRRLPGPADNAEVRG